jgi:hypothetical protein
MMTGKGLRLPRLFEARNDSFSVFFLGTIMRQLISAVTLLTIVGCGNAMKTSASMELLKREQSASAKNAVEQTSGRDSMNVSPTFAISGGGGVIILLILSTLFLLKWKKSRKTIQCLISAIETTQSPSTKKLKHTIAKNALSHGIADYLHRCLK